MEIWIYVVSGTEVFGWELVWDEPSTQKHHRLFDSGPLYSSADQARREAELAQEADEELAQVPISEDLVDRTL